MEEDPSPDASTDPDNTDPAVERSWRPGAAPASPTDAPPEPDAEPDPAPDAPSGPEGEAARPSTEKGPVDETGPDDAGADFPTEAPSADGTPTPSGSEHRPDVEGGQAPSAEGPRPHDELAADPPQDASASDEGPDPSNPAASPSPDASPSTTPPSPASNDDPSVPRAAEPDDPVADPSSAPAAGASASGTEESAEIPTDSLPGASPPDAPDRPASGDATSPDGADADEAPPDPSPAPPGDDDRSPSDTRPSPDSSAESPSAAAAPEDTPEQIETEISEDADGDAPDREAAREEGKQINEEAFADDADERSWTDRLDENDGRPDGAQSRDPDRDDFYTDQRRGVRGAEQIEEEIQDFVYEANDGPVDTDWTPSKVEARKTATMFAILVSKVAEDMSYQRTPGDEFWDPRKIMRRQIDNRPLRHCKMDYTKRRLALLVDTSPSCRDEAVFYSKIASGAMLRDDIDIFLCPNGRIDACFDPEPMRFVDDDRGADWALDGRTVLYFTDWDGADEIVTHSRACNLYWFDNCPPADYWESLRDRHQRVRLQYRGRHFHCPDPDAFQRLARKIRP